MMANTETGRRLVAALAIAALGLTLAGCTPSPTVLPDATVEHEGSSPLDQDEWVQAVRAAELAQALAWNSADFTIEALVESTSPSEIEEQYESYATNVRRDRAPFVYSGPPIWAPIAVEPSGDTALVQACVAFQDRTIDEKSPETSYDLAAGTVWEWTFQRVESGAIERTGNSETAETCSAETAEVLAFDPKPTVPEKISEGDIRKPAGE